MSVSIIACQMAVIDPDDALCIKIVLQPLFNVCLGHGLVTMGCQQTTSRGEHSTFAVALDGAAFEHEVQTVRIFAFHLFLLIESTVDGIVEFGREFLAPAVKAEIEQTGMPLVVDECDEAMIARPGIVRWTWNMEHGTWNIGLRFGNNHEVLTLGDFTGHFVVGGSDLIKHRRPVSTSMWPCQLYAPLRLPFCWQTPSG